MANSTIPVFDRHDIARNKTSAGLAYLLFFIPLIRCPSSDFARFHANQALLNQLLIVGLAALGALLAVTVVIPVLAYLALIMVVVFNVSGMINAFKGTAYRMPVYGKWNLLKFF